MNIVVQIGWAVIFICGELVAFAVVLGIIGLIRKWRNKIRSSKKGREHVKETK
jgi:hypothetical protein